MGPLLVSWQTGTRLNFINETLMNHRHPISRVFASSVALLLGQPTMAAAPTRLAAIRAMSINLSMTCERGTLKARVILASTTPATLQTLEFTQWQD
ncbi:MAG: hypothetical protein ABI821_14795 [Pseudomonadota bacterium]